MASFPVSSGLNHSLSTRHPLPLRPRFKPPNENANLKPRLPRRVRDSLKLMDTNRPAPAALTPLAPGLPPKPLGPLPPPPLARPLRSKKPTSTHDRQGSIRSLSSSSTLLSPTTREDASLRRALDTSQPLPAPQSLKTPVPNPERALAAARLRQAATDAAARKTCAPRPHYTPKPLLLPSKLARAGTTQKRLSVRSQTLDQLIGKSSHHFSFTSQSHPLSPSPRSRWTFS